MLFTPEQEAAILTRDRNLIVTAGAGSGKTRVLVERFVRLLDDNPGWALPSCGSVFKNPPGKFAAQLIEAAGLKGYCLGNACVSDKHANFIISKADTRASDVEALIVYIQDTVAERFDVRLETEVRIVGEEA